MIEFGSRARKLPAPLRVVWGSLVDAPPAGGAAVARVAGRRGGAARAQQSEPDSVVWSALWPGRPRDEVHLELSGAGSETLLRFTLLTPDDAPDASKAGHLRSRMNHLLFADLRFSYGQ